MTKTMFLNTSKPYHSVIKGLLVFFSFYNSHIIHDIIHQIVFGFVALYFVYYV